MLWNGFQLDEGGKGRYGILILLLAKQSEKNHYKKKFTNEDRGNAPQHQII